MVGLSSFVGPAIQLFIYRDRGLADPIIVVQCHVLGDWGGGDTLGSLPKGGLFGLTNKATDDIPLDVKGINSYYIRINNLKKLDRKNVPSIRLVMPVLTDSKI